MSQYGWWDSVLSPPFQPVITDLLGSAASASTWALPRPIVVLKGIGSLENLHLIFTQRALPLTLNIIYF